MRNPETASIIERLIACRDTLKVVEGQFAVNLQPERAVMADAANALDAYDKTMQRIAEAPSPTPPAGDGWEPIETAPKDGTDVLLAGALGGGWRVTVGHWTTDEECRTPIGDCGGECRCIEYDYHDPSWISWDGGFCDPWPATHWQPLPAPPEQAPTPQGEGRGE